MAQALVRYLAHSFELRTAEPAADTPIAELLGTVEALLAS